MTADGAASPEPGRAAGMELFYSAESIRLATEWPAADRSGLQPAAHIDHARGRAREDIAGLLLARYGSLPAAARAGARNVLDVLYCGTSADPPHSPPAAEHGLRESVAEVFRWTSTAADPRGTGPLRLWFTAESVLLARRGGYANPARNQLDPRGHRDWSAKVPVRSLIRDLADKTHEQFERALTAGPDEATRFLAELMARYAAWGGHPPPGAPPTASPGEWEAASAAWADGSPGQAWRRADTMLRDTAWRLLTQGRAAPRGLSPPTCPAGTSSAARR